MHYLRIYINSIGSLKKIGEMQKLKSLNFSKKKRNNKNVLHTVVLKDYWDKKDFQDMGPLSVNSIHIR